MLTEKQIELIEDACFSKTDNAVLKKFILDLLEDRKYWIKAFENRNNRYRAWQSKYVKLRAKFGLPAYEGDDK